MTSGSAGDQTAVRPPSSASTTSSTSSASSKHVKCIGRYVLTGETLGKGNFARVESAVHTLTKTKVAIKIIEIDKIKEEYVKKNLLREAQLMRRLRHPNIIRLYETMKTSTLYCLVTEIAEGGELLSHVRNDCKEKRLSEATTRQYIRQLVSALDYLHSAGIVHRDLKMENILLDKNKKMVKIVDFGLSNAQKSGALLQTHCGSPEYAAPELFIPGREYGPEVDVWSLGVNMYAMLVGRLPFRSPRQGTKRRQKLLEQITAGLSDTHRHEMEHLTEGAIDLIGQLLQPNPSERIQLSEVMAHPWPTKERTHPLVPYRSPPQDPGLQKMVMEMMAPVVEVSLTDLRESVRRDRCDWMAAIFNLLMDYPDGRSILEKSLSNDDRSQSVESSDESLNGTSGFSQGLSQDVLELTEAGLIQPVKRSHPKIVSSQNGYSSASHKRQKSQDQIDKMGHIAEENSPPAAYIKQPHSSYHKSTLTAPSRTMGRRVSITSPVSSPEHILAGTSGRKLPQPPSADSPTTGTISPHHHNRRESAPAPLPRPFRATIAPQTQLFAASNQKYKYERVPSQSSDSDGGGIFQLKPPPTSHSPSSGRRVALSQDTNAMDPLGMGTPRTLNPVRPRSTSESRYGGHSQKTYESGRGTYTTWKVQKSHIIGPKHHSTSVGNIRHSLDHIPAPVPNGWSQQVTSPNNSSTFGSSMQKMNGQSLFPSAKSPVDIHQSLKDLRQHPASSYTSEHEHGMRLNSQIVNGPLKPDIDIKTDMFAPKGGHHGNSIAMALSQDTGSSVYNEYSYHHQHHVYPDKKSLPRPKTVSLSSPYGSRSNALSDAIASQGSHPSQLPSIEDTQGKGKRPSSSRSKSISGFLGRALKITSLKSRNAEK